MLNDYLSEKIDKLKLIIDAYDDALLALLTGGVQSYMIDTGQSRQTVTKMDIASLQSKRESLYNQLVTLNGRINGGVSVMSVPAW